MAAGQIGGFALLAVLAVGTSLAVAILFRRAKNRRIHRKQLIASWRTELFGVGRDSIDLPTSSGGFAFMQTSAYSSLRPHLSKAFRDSLEAERQVMQFVIEEGRIVGLVGDYPYKQLREEIARIEREWKLT
jgi:hypothetical protein